MAESLNVACVKWGTKYTASHVNRLYRMVCKNLDRPFEFYCLTEDSSGIDPNIKIIPLADLSLDSYWHKLQLFKQDQFIGFCLYFDLDTVIQRTIDWVDWDNPKLCGVCTYWNPVETDQTFENPMFRLKTPFNSSIMYWKAEDYYWLWDRFQNNRDYYICLYYGDDKFIGNEVKDKNFWALGLFYSRLYGSGSWRHGKYERVKLRLDLSQELWRDPRAAVCLFNGPTTEEHYQGFEHYWL